jgi:hypothetical protein
MEINEGALTGHLRTEILMELVPDNPITDHVMLRDPGEMATDALWFKKSKLDMTSSLAESWMLEKLLFIDCAVESHKEEFMERFRAGPGNLAVFPAASWRRSSSSSTGMGSPAAAMIDTAAVDEKTVEVETFTRTNVVALWFTWNPNDSVGSWIALSW